MNKRIYDGFFFYEERRINIFAVIDERGKIQYWTCEYNPNPNEKWFYKRNEHGQLLKSENATYEARSASSIKEAKNLIVSWLDAALKFKLFVVKIQDKHGKISDITTCAIDEQDLHEFFDRKKSKVLSWDILKI